MTAYTTKELEEGLKAMESLVHKSEKALASLVQGTSAYTTLSRRIKAFRMAYDMIHMELEGRKTS